MLIPRFASFMKTVIGLLGLMAALSQSGALAQELPKEPILRIETGMHTFIISSIGVDAANRYLVTASIDKTLRVWELESGSLLKVIRPPSDNDLVGRLTAAAVSPDGNSIVTGGQTAAGGQTAESAIYVFDRASGNITRSIKGLTTMVRHLVFSKDGRFLIATLANGGIRLYESQNYQLIGIDKDYGGESFGADLTSNNKLVTTSFDSYIRLYEFGNNGLRLITKKKAGGGKLPYSVAISPDGAKLAVGYYDSIRVSVLSATDLSLLYSPDVIGLESSFGIPVINHLVTWGANGNTLYAGGTGDTKGTLIIRMWVGGGRGTYRDIPTSRDALTDMVTLNDGGIVYVAQDPVFGVLDKDGNQRLFKKPDKIVFGVATNLDDYKRLAGGFLVSKDATVVQFGAENSIVRFSLSDKLLDTASTSPSSLQPPIKQLAGFGFTDIFGTNQPKLNGKQLKLVQFELSTSLAIAPNESNFLLGTTNFLRLYDRNGTLKWGRSVPVVYFVNISGDNNTAIAALGDGTVRWYRMSDGKELLALFTTADRKRWVLWTPSGYYDASPGAEDLIGWHVNNGKEQAADFFPVGRFRSVYYRPDVIEKVLLKQDETIALRVANEESGRRQQQADILQRLPPVVEIASPTDGAETTATEITVRFRVRSPSGEPVTGIKALVDGRPVNGGRGLKHSGQASDLQEMTVTVPEQDSEVSLLAENRYAVSVPATVRVRWRGARASKDEFTIKPKLYVLAVGVSKYANKDLTLGFAAKDASDFVATMERQKGGLYRDVVVKLLTDEKATKDEVLDGLDWIRKETTSKDVAMVFMAGHGVNDQNGFYFFCPYNIDPEKILRTGVPFTDIKNTVSSLAGKTLFFVDTCHSGNVMGTRRALVDVTAIINELTSAENGAVVFAASTGNQYSLENVEWGNGAFTKALVEALSGRADYGGKGKITINMVDLYLSERVKELTKGKQTPTTTKPQTIQDFPIAVKQ